MADGTASPPPGIDPDVWAYIQAQQQGSGAIPTTGPDIWNTGEYGDMEVSLGKIQTGGPTGFLASALGGDFESSSKAKAPTAAQQRLLDREEGSGTSRFVPRTFTDQTATVNQVLQGGYQMSQDDLKALQQKLWLAGMYDGTGVKTAQEIPYGTYDEDTIQAYGKLLSLSAEQRARGQDVSWGDTLDSLIQQRTQTGQAGGSTTRTSTSYDLSDPDTAKAILSSVLEAYTGIGIPDAKTTAAFQAALNSYEKQHPSVTTSTYDSNGGGTDSSSTGGLTQAGRSQFAQDYLFQNQGHDVANYQAATTYFQAAMQALQAPVGLNGNG